MRTKLILAALLLGATMAPASAAGSVCLRHSDVDGWGARDNKSVVVNDRFGKKYLVSLAGLCSDINWAFGMGFRPLGGVAGANCVDRGDRLVMRGGGTTAASSGSCWVTKIQYYTPEMQSADKQAKANHQPLPAY